MGRTAFEWSGLCGGLFGSLFDGLILIRHHAAWVLCDIWCLGIASGGQSRQDVPSGTHGTRGVERLAAAIPIGPLGGQQRVQLLSCNTEVLASDRMTSNSRGCSASVQEGAISVVGFLPADFEISTS